MGALSKAWAWGGEALGAAGARIDRGLISGGMSVGRKLGLGALEGPPTRNAARLAGLGRGIAGAAGYLATNPIARNAAVGAVAGGAIGGMSENGSVMGGALTGAAIGGAGTYGFRALHRGLAARAARQGAASAKKMGPQMAANAGWSNRNSNSVPGVIQDQMHRQAKIMGRPDYVKNPNVPARNRMAYMGTPTSGRPGMDKGGVIEDLMAARAPSGGWKDRLGAPTDDVLSKLAGLRRGVDFSTHGMGGVRAAVPGVSEDFLNKLRR